MKLKNILTLLKSPNRSAQFKTMKDMQSYIRFHFFYAAHESGLLKALRKPKTLNEIIRDLDIKQPEHLEPLVDLGLSLKELAIKNGRYYLKGKCSKLFAVKEGDGPIALVQGQVTYYNSTYRHAAERMRGAPEGDYLEYIGPIVARFGKILEPFIKNFVHKVVHNKGALKLLDVGCGAGFHLKSALELNPNIQAVGIDMDKSVIEDAQKNLVDWGIQNNCSVFQGDVLKPDQSFQKKYDVITLHNVVYYFPVNERRELFQSLRSLLADRGTLAITNSTQSLGRSFASANLDMALRAIKGCFAMPVLDELIEQLKGSGFNEVETIHLLPGDAYYGIIAR